MASKPWQSQDGRDISWEMHGKGERGRLLTDARKARIRCFRLLAAAGCHCANFDPAT